MHCSKFIGDWGLGSVIRRSCSLQNNRKKWHRKSGFTTVPQRSSKEFFKSDTKLPKFPSLGSLPIYTQCLFTGFLPIPHILVVFLYYKIYTKYVVRLNSLITPLPPIPPNCQKPTLYTYWIDSVLNCHTALSEQIICIQLE